MTTFSVFKFLLKPLQCVTSISHPIHTLSRSSVGSLVLNKEDPFSLMSIRNKVRCYFPRPNEVRRVRRHGWEARMSTPKGRKIIMRRILKGRFVLSH